MRCTANAPILSGRRVPALPLPRPRSLVARRSVLPVAEGDCPQASSSSLLSVNAIIMGARIHGTTREVLVCAPNTGRGSPQTQSCRAVPDPLRVDSVSQMPVSRIFVGYASQPSQLADTVRSAAGRIGQLPDVDLQTWEELRIGGQLHLTAIEAAIRRADLTIFDLTQLNENVLFELGLALGANKAIWPLRDFSDTTRQAEWASIGLLDTVGQARFTNSDQVHAAFLAERPDLNTSSLFQDILAPQLVAGRAPALFYFAEALQTDAGRQVLTHLQKRASDDLALIVADPQEASVQTLSWFAQHLYAAEAVIIHLASRRRAGADAHNARASLIAGLARGMRRPLLMLAEDDYASALDYRDLLYRYPTAAEARTRLSYWLERELVPTDQRLAAARDEAEALKLSTELRSVDLGEYVAENEARGLEKYFVETASFREVLSGASRVYVGSKGTGKSATVLRAEARLTADKRNLVCTIKPAGYDLNGLVRLLGTYEERDVKGYIAESLWKYLLATELALAVEQDLANRPAGVMPVGPEWALLKYIGDNERWIKADFASRLERAIEALLEGPKPRRVADQRQHVAEALHAGPLRQLREVLAPALAERERVFIIVDNLDKAWDRGADISQLSRVILGLLACMDAFRADLERSAGGRGIAVSLSLFVRSDIFASVASLAREPDKLPVRRITWVDEVSLLDIVDSRYAASRSQEPPPRELWTRYFVDTKGGLPTTEWLLRTCLPRPRDVLFLCRAAIDQAVAHKHARVEEQDLAVAERQYSLFAFEAAAVETQQRIERADDVLLEFAGASTQLTATQLRDLLRAGGISEDAQRETIDALRDVSFLGLRTGRGANQASVYTDSPREKQRADVLARRLASADDGEITYVVHPAFWAYLEMQRSDRTPSLGV
jgi:hypothetical protein